uniref:Uncharacterized protein n=1 Tax=Anguilla anguilla TaxID=7936 RepID=A0A0E9TAB9_ANGAN
MVTHRPGFVCCWGNFRFGENACLKRNCKSISLITMHIELPLACYHKAFSLQSLS